MTESGRSRKNSLQEAVRAALRAAVEDDSPTTPEQTAAQLTAVARRTRSRGPRSAGSSRSMGPPARPKSSKRSAQTEADKERSRSRSPVEVSSFRAVVGADRYRAEKTVPAGDGTGPGKKRKTTKDMTASELVTEVDEAVGDVSLVCKTSKALPGCFQKRLNQSVLTIRDAVVALAARLEPEENLRLRNDKRRLEAEIDVIKSELLAFKRSNEELCRQVAELRNNVGPMVVEAPARPPPPEPADFEALINAAVERASEKTLGATARMLEGRLAGLEDRLPPAPVIRPPLAADKKKAAPQTPAQAAASSSARTRPVATSAPRQLPAPTARPGPISSRRSEATRPQPSPSEAVDVDMEVDDGPPPTGPPGEEGTWAQAVGRKKRGRAARKARAAAAPPPPAATTKKAAPAKKGPKLAPPKTAAVILKLRPEAAAGGTTYREVMDTLVKSSTLEDLGLVGQIRVRHTMAGARILELAAMHGPDIADQLAVKVRASLAGMADVVRPVKTADLRLTELDDSATVESVVAAIVVATGCPAGQVRALSIRDGPAGMGTTIVTCPVAVAKTLVDRGRLLHGWTSARVVALEQRALRCFNCMAIGHTSATCPSPGKSKRNICFRCGAEGHKVGTCTAAYRCAVCADSGRKCDHQMGGRACFPPRVKGRTAVGAPPRPAERMDVQSPPAGGDSAAAN